MKLCRCKSSLAFSYVARLISDFLDSLRLWKSLDIRSVPKVPLPKYRKVPIISENRLLEHPCMFFCVCDRYSSYPCTKRGNGGHIFVPQAIFEHAITAFDQPNTVGVSDD